MKSLHPEEKQLADLWFKDRRKIIPKLTKSGQSFFKVAILPKIKVPVSSAPPEQTIKYDHLIFEREFDHHKEWARFFCTLKGKKYCLESIPFDTLEYVVSHPPYKNPNVFQQGANDWIEERLRIMYQERRSDLFKAGLDELNFAATTMPMPLPFDVTFYRRYNLKDADFPEYFILGRIEGTYTAAELERGLL